MDKSAAESSKPARLHRITFEPMGISSQACEGQSIMEAADGGNIILRSDCGGQGSCGQCLVSIHPITHLSAVTDSEVALLQPEQIQNGYRLACQAKIRGALSVSVSDSVLESREAVGKSGVDETYSCDATVKRIVLSKKVLPGPEDIAAKDSIQVIRNRVKKAWGQEVMFREVEALRMLSRLQSGIDAITLVNHYQKGVTAVLDGERSNSLGIAVDIGTTTLAVYLCDLQKGKVLKSASSANPQRRFGEDVISRIAYANENADGLLRLQKSIIDEINILTNQCVRATGADLQDIDEVTVVGNTTMEQILMGLHPRGLGVSPYLPVFSGFHDVGARDLGIALNPATNVYVFPVISGFVGGDTVGVILSERPYERDDITLIVDIGTNGELVLGNKKGIWTTSCATGPALEGAHIHCGMRATAGAIEKVSINPTDYTVTYDVLGKATPPRGICGSGIIDAVAEMLRAGLILPTGRIQEGLPGVCVDGEGIGRKFVVVSADDASVKKEIAITLKDIRQVQLAKSALSVGIRLLMRKAGFNHFDRLVLTGAFGARFNWKNAVAIGMLPGISYRTEVKVVENAAGRGAIMALMDRKLRKKIYDVAGQVQALELAQEPDFAEEFATATLFPEQTAF